MALVKFKKEETLRGEVFEEGSTYDLPDNLVNKYVSLMGSAVLVDEADAVSPTPEIPEAEVEKPAPVQETSDSPYRPLDRALEDSEEDSEDSEKPTTSGVYVLESRGGPWFDVVDETGEKYNQKPLTKAKAQELLNELNAKSESVSDEESE